MKRWFQIQGWFNFADTYDRAVAHFPSGSHFVEVGCWKGRSSLYLLERIRESGKDIWLTCVDHFKGSKEHGDVDGDALYAEFMENVRGYEGCELDVPRLPSLTVAKLFVDGSVDFVFLDGSHEEQDVYDDIAAWSPKLKPTGVLAGDDITEFPGVRSALLRHGFGTKERPLVLGGSAQPSWIVPPQGQEEAWKTPRS